MTAYRCSASSLARVEPLLATASTVRAFLLLEYDGAWGREALRDTRLPAEVSRHLRAESARLGVKTLLMRRHGRRTAAHGRSRVFAAYADPEQPWLEAAELASVAEVLDIDLGQLARGVSPGLEAHEEPVFAVCTHGRHDTCCAELGRPLAATLSLHDREHTWEVSHIGGDRFAGNLLVLPDGLYYGRVSSLDVVALVEGHLAGRLSRPHLRGRSGFPLSVQAAEHYLREALQEDSLDGVRLRDRRRDGDTWQVHLQVRDTLWRVRLHGESQEPVQLTCAVARLAPTLRFGLSGIDRIDRIDAAGVPSDPPGSSPAGAAGNALERPGDA